VGHGPDGSPRKTPWWLVAASRRAAYAVAGVWSVYAALALVGLVLADDVAMRWISAWQFLTGLLLAVLYLRAARYDGPREVRPSSSRWGPGRPGERWR